MGPDHTDLKLSTYPPAVHAPRPPKIAFMVEYGANSTCDPNKEDDDDNCDPITEKVMDQAQVTGSLGYLIA